MNFHWTVLGLLSAGLLLGRPMLGECCCSRDLVKQESSGCCGEAPAQESTPCSPGLSSCDCDTVSDFPGADKIHEGGSKRASSPEWPLFCASFPPLPPPRSKAFTILSSRGFSPPFRTPLVLRI